MPAVIRVTKEFHFEMAHVLWNYDGPCRNVHGHSYHLYVTVTGSPLEDPDNPKTGMVIDFTDLKRIVKKEIINIFDHSIVLSSRFDKTKLDQFSSIFGNTVIVDYQPTSENLILDFSCRIRSQLPAPVKLHSLRLYETSTSYAEWHASDNQ